MLNEIFSNKNSKTCSDIVYLDISKAFDSVSHDVLLLKLQLMGISGTILNWFKAYLDNRRQLVSVNGSFLPVTSGVPQGSILASSPGSLFRQRAWSLISRERTQKSANINERGCNKPHAHDA